MSLAPVLAIIRRGRNDRMSVIADRIISIVDVILNHGKTTGYYPF